MFNLGQWLILRKAKREVRKHLSTDGFKFVAADLGAVAATAPMVGLSDSEIDAIWAKAEASGHLSDQIVVDYATTMLEMPQAVVGGAIGDFIKRIIAWLEVPGNIEKLISFIMLILSLFGL